MKKIWLIMALATLMVSMLASAVSATSIELVNGSVHGNVTIRGDVVGLNITGFQVNYTSCAYTLSSPDTNASGSTGVGHGFLFANITDEEHGLLSGAAAEAQGWEPAFTSLNSEAFLDANTYNLTAHCSKPHTTLSNTSEEVVFRANNSLVIDNRFPPVPTSLTPSGIQRTRDLTFSATVDTDARSCVWTFNRLPVSSSPARQTVAANGTTCSLSLTNLGEGGFDYRVTASDGQNDSTTSIVSVDVRYGGSGRRIYAPGAMPEPEVSAAQAATNKVGSFFIGVATTIRDLLVGIVDWIKGIAG